MLFKTSCYCTPNRLQYGENITLNALSKIHMTSFTEKFTLLWWSGTKPTVSLRYACARKHLRTPNNKSAEMEM